MKRTGRLFSAVLALLLLCACAAAPDNSASGSPAASSASSAGAAASSSAEAPPTPQELALETAQARMATLSDAEKVGQLFFVRCPDTQAVEDVSAYHLGGYLLFTRDFRDTSGQWLSRDDFLKTIQSYQAAAAIPLFIGSDEEGGSVTRASRNPNLFAAPFRSPQDLYQSGGIDALINDAAVKSQALLDLGINVNFAPVCDVADDPSSFLYDRTLGLDAAATAEAVSQVTVQMGRTGIAAVLKHFPGYGDNADTHTGIAVDDRSYDTFLTRDFLPFEAGIRAGAPFVLVSHNIVSCMDAALPASLSPQVHRILREECGFEGLAITDDLAMDAVKAYAQDGSVAVLALQAGNDMLVTTDYRTQIPAVLAALEDGTLSRDLVEQACLRVLTTKALMGLL